MTQTETISGQAQDMHSSADQVLRANQRLNEAR
jgi:ATP-dependent protease ClpP protease subunit